MKTGILDGGYESRVFYIEGATNGVIEDILITGGNRRGISTGDAGGGLCLSNNISMTLRGCIITNNCIRINPMFMRPGARDFSLRSASPCRETGMVLGWHAGATDLIGNLRVIPPNGRVDMGALEGLPISASVIVLR